MNDLMAIAMTMSVYSVKSDSELATESGVMGMISEDPSLGAGY